MNLADLGLYVAAGYFEGDNRNIIVPTALVCQLGEVLQSPFSIIRQ